MKKLVLTLVILTMAQSYCNTTQNLIHAITSNNMEKVKQIVGQDKEGKLINGVDNNKMTPLHWAAELGNQAIAKLLIDNKADVNIKDKMGFTPLHWAAYFDKKDVAEELLNNSNSNIDVNVKSDFGWTVLDTAKRHKHHNIVEMIQKKIQDLIKQKTMKTQQTKMLGQQKGSAFGDVKFVW